MDFEQKKNAILGMGIRRLRYEQRLKRLRDKDFFDLGIELGLNKSEAFMLEEIIREHMLDLTEEYLDVLYYPNFSKN